MTSIKLDIKVSKLLDSLVSGIDNPDTKSVPMLIGRIILDQLKDQLQAEVGSGNIVRYKINWQRPGFAMARMDPSLNKLQDQKVIDFGYYLITFVTNLDSPCDFKLVQPQYIQFIVPFKIQTQKLETVCKHTIRLYGIGLKTDIFSSVIQSLVPKCQCPKENLVPQIERVWDWWLTFKCKVCGQSYYCECFRYAIEKHYHTAIEERAGYRSGGWPHRYIATYNSSTFKDGICHLCRDVSSDLFFCAPIYGSKVLVHYGPYIYKTSIEKEIDLRASENQVRDILGIPRIGEGWISEVELLNIVKEIFENEEVLHQASPEWLAPQRLDIFVPSKDLAIEYQGRQHYEPVDYFGGLDGFKKTQERDRLKASLCLSHGVKLIYFRFDEDISKRFVQTRIKEVLENKR